MTQEASLYWPVAFALGALHSFEPAHGKAVLAAYLIGHQRKLTETFFFGLLITVAHSLSILALGFGAWMAAGYYGLSVTGPAMSLVGGLLVLTVGFWMLLRWGRRACAHPGHGHHDTTSPEEKARHNGSGREEKSFGQLLMLGFGGGLVPCPAGVAMLTSSMATGDLSGGLGLAIAFSLGAGVVVIALSVALQRMSSLSMKRLAADTPIAEYIPLISSLLVILVGLWLSSIAFLDLMMGQGGLSV